MKMQNILILLSIFTISGVASLDQIVTAGYFQKIYDPSIGEKQKWYINDHTFIKDKNGTWHLFGITHIEPADPQHEIVFAHATAPKLHGPWTKQPFALTADIKYYNETHLWAPHVILVNDTYYMFYCGGGPDNSQSAISMALSKDLFHWTKRENGPLFRDGIDARDPMVIKINGTWHMYYDATSTPKGGNHIVAYRTSHDLIHWSEKHIALTDPEKGTGGGATESPFIVYRDGWWYLFTGPRYDYRGTTVFRSKDPTHFPFEQMVGQIYSHAAEVVFDDGKYWISHCGWGMGGVYIAPLGYLTQW